MASIRKRGNSYLVVVSRGYDHHGNRLKRAQKTFKPPEGLTPKQEEKWIAEQAVIYEREVREQVGELPKDITLAKYYEHFLRDVMPSKLGYSTQDRMHRDMDRIIPLLGHYKLKQLSKPIIRAAYTELKKLRNKKTGGPLSERTLSGIHANFCSVLTSAVEEGYIDTNPAWKCWYWGGKRKEERKVADEKTAQMIINALNKESILYETYYKIILATGMRRGECCALRWCDINFDEEYITVQRNIVRKNGGGVVVKEPKTEAGFRDIYVSATLLVLIQEYREWVRNYRWPENGKEMTEDDYIFFVAGNVREPMVPDTFTHRFRHILEKNNLPNYLTLHSLRHTNASLQIAQGVDVRTVASNLGHSMPSTTLDIYSHAFNKYKKASQEKLTTVLSI